MKLLTAFFCSLFFFVSMSPAQNKYSGTGAILDEKRFKAVPKIGEFSGAKTRRSKRIYSLRKYCPIAGDQKKSNTCVGWAVGYSAMTICRAIKNKMSDRYNISETAHSATFIFNQIKKGQCKGAIITDALDLLKNKGDCLLKTFGDDPLDCKKEPSPNHLSEAEKYKIKDYAALFYADDEAIEKVNKTIDAIALDNPVILIMHISQSFYDIAIGQRSWSPGADQIDFGSGHAMVVTGYNLATKEFEILNSWGPNWADKGFIHISFSDFSKLALYGFQMVLDEKNEISSSSIESEGQSTNIDLKGEFYILPHPENPYENNIELVNENISFVKDGTYNVISSEWKVYDSFRLEAQNLSKGTYFYLISINSRNQANLLYPLPRDFNQESHYAHFVPGDSLTIVYPPGEEWLWFDTTGSDNLCALFSLRPIENIEEKMVLIGQLEGSIIERLNSVVGEKMIESKNVQYELDRMSFHINLQPDEDKVVPLILNIPVK